jgi:hypothetical protein
MKTICSLLFLLIFSSALAEEAKKVAVVKLLKGEADILTLGKTTRLKIEDWVEEGGVVKTGEKSFVRLIFIDKSQMNVGPNSEIKIESFTGKDSGVIDLVKGKIRSQVSKDYLQMQEKDKSKLFIKTPNAVMGVRGTDFMISTNGKNTSAVLFEGEIAFNRLDGKIGNSEKLEDVVNKGVRLFPGEFSVVDQSRSMPTVPAILNVQQRENLEKNENFESDRAPSNASADYASKGVIPEGLNGEIVANNSDVIMGEVGQTEKTESAKNPNGFVDGDKIKPANGSVLHVDSGLIIPPGPDSVFDPNTSSFIPGPSIGAVSGDGNYMPPANVEITNDGTILVAHKSSDGTLKVTQAPPPSPVVTSAPLINSTSSISTFSAPVPMPGSSQATSGTVTFTTLQNSSVAAQLPTTNTNINTDLMNTFQQGAGGLINADITVTPP